MNHETVPIENYLSNDAVAKVSATRESGEFKVSIEGSSDSGIQPADVLSLLPEGTQGPGLANHHSYFGKEVKWRGRRLYASGLTQVTLQDKKCYPVVSLFLHERVPVNAWANIAAAVSLNQEPDGKGRDLHGVVWYDPSVHTDMRRFESILLKSASQKLAIDPQFNFETLLMTEEEVHRRWVRFLGGNACLIGVIPDLTRDFSWQAKMEIRLMTQVLDYVR